MTDYQACRKAYKFYLETYYDDHDEGNFPVYFNEFYDNEWQDEETKDYYMKLINGQSTEM